MEFLYLLEKIRNPFLDAVFSVITAMGEEMFFLAVAIILFWCVNKREGYYILMCGLIGTLINQGIKMIARIERPWIIDTDFSPVGGAVKEATGYSFPSGHTQNTVCTFGAIGVSTRRGWLKAVSIAVIALVSFSRMYLGVHTPKDVAVSLLIGGVLVFVFSFVFKDEKSFDRFMPWLVCAAALLSLGLLLYTQLLPDVIDTADAVRLESYIKNLGDTRENAATLFGCMLGLLLVYPLDRFVIKFETKARWYSNVIKAALGFAIVLLILEGLEYPIEALVGLFTDTPALVARVIRYFLTVAFAGAVWPLTFRFFSRLSIPAMERFTAWVKKKVKKT